MLATKWLLFLFMLFAIGATISGVLEMNYAGASSPAWNDLVATWGEVTSSPLGIFTVPALAWEAIVAIWNIFTWNYAFFDGPFAMFRYVVLMPLSAAMALTFVLTGLSIARGGGG